MDYRVYTKLDKEGNPVREKDKDGKPGEIIREVKLATQKDPNFAKYEAANDKTADPTDGTKMECEAMQTIAKPKFGSIEAFQKYFDDDPELAMYIINLGVNSRFSTVVPKALGDTVEDGTLEFPFSETVFDPRELLTAEIGGVIFLLWKRLLVILRSLLPLELVLLILLQCFKHFRLHSRKLSKIH